MGKPNKCNLGSHSRTFLGEKSYIYVQNAEFAFLPSWCGQTFQDSQMWGAIYMWKMLYGKGNVHSWSWTNTGGKPYTCKVSLHVCRRIFTNIAYIRLIFSITQMRSLVSPWNVCGQGFLHKWHFKIIQIRNHTGGKSQIYTDSTKKWLFCKPG